MRCFLRRVSVSVSCGDQSMSMSMSRGEASRPSRGDGWQTSPEPGDSPDMSPDGWEKKEKKKREATASSIQQQAETEQRLLRWVREDTRGINMDGGECPPQLHFCLSRTNTPSPCFPIPGSIISLLRVVYVSVSSFIHPPLFLFAFSSSFLLSFRPDTYVHIYPVCSST